MGRERTRTSATAALASIVALLVVCVSGCTQSTEPLTISREILGTAVTVTVWGEDEVALRDGADAAFAEMAAVEAELDPYDETSAIAAFNRRLGFDVKLPPSATVILDRIDSLAVGDSFSPALFGVTALYSFGATESVPTTAGLLAAMRMVHWYTRDTSDTAHFYPDHGRWLGDEPEPPPPGLDFGGAAKGLALDRAMAALRKTPGVSAAMISTVSSTVTWGSKPDGTPWRIGIEDPRSTGKVLAVVSAEDTRPVNVSTSGDYQTYFERDGVRYHHILDPATGRPAAGVRSLTVFGDLSGVDADILSTALFVMGREAALEYAREHGIGIYLVDSAGRAAEWVPEGLSGIDLRIDAEPTR